MFNLSPYMSLNLKRLIFFIACLFVIIYLIVIDYELVSKSQDIKWSWTKKQTPWYSGNWCQKESNNNKNNNNNNNNNKNDKNTNTGQSRRSTGKKVLTYTLFGNPSNSWVDYLGLVGSEALDSYFYRDWMVRVYHNTTLPVESTSALLYHHPNIVFCDTRELKELQTTEFRSKVDWKLHLTGDPTVDVMCFRDIASPLLQRELDAMEQWIELRRVFHVFRDHPQHDKLLNNGLFCVNMQLDRKLATHVQRLARPRSSKISDAEFESVVWNAVRHNITQHDSYRCNSDEYREGHVPFPSARGKSSEYVGCRRPCLEEVPTCPVECRPPDHSDWAYC